jgi:hypothetical protein
LWSFSYRFYAYLTCHPTAVIYRYAQDNGALTKLNASDNGIVGKEGGKILSDMIAHNSVLKELDVSSNCKNYGDDGPGFAKELAIGISDNGALTSLDLSMNYLEAEGAKIIAKAIKVTNCAIVVIFVPFLCLSDLSSNCCYLPIFTGQWGHIVHQSPQELHARRASPRACEDHAGEGKTHHSMWSEQRGNRA